MAMHKKGFPRKTVIYLGIMLLCLMTGVDDISGFWPPLNITVPMIQSGNSQDNGENHIFKAVLIHSAWRDAINVAKQMSFSQSHLQEIKWQVSLIYLSASHTRAPPSLS